jgi:hypothetical protein
MRNITLDQFKELEISLRLNFPDDTAEQHKTRIFDYMEYRDVAPEVVAEPTVEDIEEESPEE